MSTRNFRWHWFPAAAWCLAWLITAPAPAHAAIIEYSSRDSFIAAVTATVTDTFSDLDTLFVPTPLVRNVDAVSYTIVADTGGRSDLVYGLPSAPSSAPATWLTTNAADSVLNFSGFAPGTNGIGASFFSTNVFGDIWLYTDASLRVTATFANGSVSKILSQTTDTYFLGFVSTEQLLTLTVAAIQPASGGPYWLTVANLTLATPVPEASSAALLSVGLLLFCRLRRKRQAAAP
jgi:hypothetical protein